MADDLNEILEETMDDASVVTVPIDDTLSNSGEAADAAAVGAALALKADASAVTAISVNGQTADNQGKILVDGSDIPVSGTDATKMDAAIEALQAKNATTIPMSSAAGAQSIAEAISGVSGQTAATIPLAAGGTETIGERLAVIGATVSTQGTDIEALKARTGNTIPAYEGGPSILDAIGERVKTVNNQGADAAGNVQVNNVPFADNLTSSSSETSAETFVFRTTGGNSSVNTGDAWLQKIMGNNAHTGHVPASVNMIVSGDGITATIDEEDFLAAASSDSGTMTFSYTSSWDTSPASYGITVTGTPVNGDTITVTYAKEVRGTITVADPQSFVATGWNLYDHSKGYAKVKKYSEVYKYGISGAYTAIKYSATVGGNQTSISVINGQFDIIADGYIYVTGGDATTTKIWPTWSDWQAQANGGVFEAYTETEIDISDIMSAYFPNGLMKAGAVQDELNLSTGKAIQRVERIDYSTENLATAKSSGRSYEYDENYIYIALASEVENSVAINNAYTANDHGLEYFTGTDVDVPAWTMYGQNLKNKLERDTLTMSQQTLTSAQKTQVQANIGMRVANNMTTTEAGYVLDARQGKAIKDKLDVVKATNWSGTIGTDNTSVASGENKKLGEITLTPGSYILVFTVEWGSNTSGMRTMWIAENSDTTSSLGIGCTNTVAPVTGNVTRQQVVLPYYTSTNKTLYVCGSQNSGSSLTAKARYGKARIS